MVKNVGDSGTIFSPSVLYNEVVRSSQEAKELGGRRASLVPGK
jgi:hypothetical protein